MSTGFREYLSKLYGSEQRSDCTILFCCPRDTTQRKKGSAGGQPHEFRSKRQKIGAVRDLDEHALPAHLFVVRGGSPMLCAQADRWTERRQDSLANVKPVLRVVLDSADDLPFAQLAIRVMYTGQLDVCSFRALLSVRRLGEYLHVVGCEEACTAALTALIASSGEGGALSGVADVFLHRSSVEDGSADSVFLQTARNECRKQLVLHAAAVKPGEPIMPGGPSLGDVLAWAFVDAPSLLSDLDMVRQLQRLPACAMEALLGSASFATDDEASVLLVLATWRFGDSQSKDVSKKLCKLIRLSQLSATYLHIVLPRVSWFPITPAELCLHTTYAQASPEKREYLRRAFSKYDMSCAWYSPAPRPGYDTRRVMSYDWEVPLTQLVAMAQGIITDDEEDEDEEEDEDDEEDEDHEDEEDNAGRIGHVFATFMGGASAVVCQGYKWKVSITYDEDTDTAGMFLWCIYPKELREYCMPKTPDAVCPGRAELVVYKWHEDGSKVVDWSMGFGDKWVPISQRRGTVAALKLLPLSDEDDSPIKVAAAYQWSRHLHEGKIHGVLRWW